MVNNIFNEINSIIGNKSIDYPGIDSIIYEDYMDSGYLVDNIDYYLEKYYGESVRNNLPKWKGELYSYYKIEIDYDEPDFDYKNNHTLPLNRMKHIIDGHSIRKRIDITCRDFESSLKNDLRIHSKTMFESIITSIKYKIRIINGIIYNTDLGNSFTKNKLFSNVELKLISRVDYYDKYGRQNDSVDHFPYYMSDLEIMKSIREAYKTAEKTSGYIQGHRVYKGKYKNITIRFLYDFNNGYIVTAFPVFK